MAGIGKRHFERVAARFRAQRPLKEGPSYGMWRDLMYVMANLYEQENGLFDRQRFVNACLAGPGVEPEEQEADVCPFDCDSCHGGDCSCDRLGCDGDGR